MLDGKIKLFVTSYSEEVTGSNNHVKIEWPDGRSVSFVVDCGLFQEKEHNHINIQKIPYKPQNILFAIATHVHTDHVGRLPYLTLNGFGGKIYCSYETAQLLPIVLHETAEHLEDEFRLESKRYRENKLQIKKIKKSVKCGNGKGRGRKDKPRHEYSKNKEKLSPPIIHCPVLIYGKEDIESIMKNVSVQQLNAPFYPCEGIEITFYPNAHIAGAVLTVCRIFNDLEEIYLLFTGDLGLTNPITNVETYIPDDIANKIDIIIAESTYGSAEISKKTNKERQKHIDIIKNTYFKKGTIMYMSNSLERPLRVGVDLKDMQQDPKINREVAAFNIYLDSTFGIKCYKKYVKLYGKDYIGDKFYLIDKDNRQQILDETGPKMIICTSPRFYQGSFLNYGARMLENPNVTLVFVAYVPEDIKNIISLPYGTEINFMGEKVTLRCKRYQLSYYSSHVSTDEMDLFLSKFNNVKTILFNHGTHDSKNNYSIRYKTNTNVTHNLIYGRTVMLSKERIDRYF